MLDFLRALRAHPDYGRRLFGFIPALVITEMFYKFHSFSLECIAFLGTWLLFDMLTEWIMGGAKTNDTSNAASDRLSASNGKSADQ
jgi:hypothetical protein